LLEEETIIDEFDNILDSDDDSDHVFEEEELDDLIEGNVEARNATIVKEDTENNLEYSTRHANIRWSKVPIRNNRKRHSQANVLKIPPGTTTYSSQFDTFSEAFFLFFYDDIIIAIVTETNRKASDFGVTSIGRRKLDARKLIAATWTRDNWTRATITRVRQLDGGHMRQLDGGHMRHALKLFHNI
jgi:hypothetical protein